MIFQFKPGAHLSGDAQAVGERLEQLRAARGGITAEAVVDDARSEASALHDLFEWDDAKAAQIQRITHAGHILRSVTVVIEDAPPEPPRQLTIAAAPAPTAASATPLVARAYLPVQRADGARVFESTAVVLSDSDYRRQVLTRAHAELGAVSQRYRDLQELAEVVGAIDRVGVMLRGEVPQPT